MSLLGQLLDEIAILWLIMAGYAMWYPRVMMPARITDKKGRKTFITLVSQMLFLAYFLVLLSLMKGFRMGHFLIGFLKSFSKFQCSKFQVSWSLFNSKVSPAFTGSKQITHDFF